MRENLVQRDAWHSEPWRVAAWLSASGLMSVPIGVQLIYGSFGWSVSDFVFAAVILSVSCFLFDWAARCAPSFAYLAGAGAGLAAGFGLVVVNGAVGLVGSEDELHNLLFVMVLFVAITGSVMAKGEPQQMAGAMLTAGITHIVISTALLISAGGVSDGDPRAEVVGLSLFAAMWLASAWLFGSAARQSRLDRPRKSTSLY